jgi:flavin-dependent dehydrogenase
LTDVFIIGGGPAGSAAARLLASWGWSVTVADRRVGGQPSLAESLPPSTRKLLTFVGLLDAVAAAGFHPNSGNVACWAEQTRTTTTDAAGFHVSRARFDEVLRRAAADAGARFVDAVVRRIDIGDPNRLTYYTRDGQTVTRLARYVLDCSGRAGVVARRGWRRPETTYRTIAIAAEWDARDWPANDAAHTIVESYRDGWAWSVPLSPTRRQFTVMIDPAKVGNDLRAAYARELAKASHLTARAALARQTSKAWACDASLYDSARASEPGALLVGDAASFIEPLSSAGVKKALTSAWRAAVVVNTCLSKPGMTGAALDFFNRREQEIYADCRRRSARFFGEALAAYDDPFWAARSDAASAAPKDEQTIAGEDDAVRDPSVRAAFDALRRAPSVRLRPAASIRIEPAATIEGREVVMRDAVVLPGVDAPLRFAAGIDLPALVGLAGQCGDVSSLIAAYHSRVAEVQVQDLLAGLSLLVAHHALINEQG